MGFAGALFGIGSSLAGADSEASAMRAKGILDKEVYDQNAKVADLQADDALRRGAKDVSQIRAGTRKLIGAQRSGYASQGVDVNSGSAADITDESQVLGEKDARTATNNAWLESWGLRSQAVDSRKKGVYAKMGADSSARNTVLTGALRAGAYGFQGLGDIAKDYGDGERGKTSTARVPR